MVGHKHSEVVDMIRDSSFVTLTLIGKLGPNGTAKGTVCVHVCTESDVVVVVYVYTIVSRASAPVPHFKGVNVAASMQTYGILIPRKCPCG